jgi:hypothetical protein
MKKRLTIIISSVVIVGALAGALFLVQQNQETRRGATSTSFINLSLNVGSTAVNVGDLFDVHLKFFAGVNIDNIRTVLCYNSTLLQLQRQNVGGTNAVAVTINDSTNSIFDQKYESADLLQVPVDLQKKPIVNPVNKCLDLTVGSTKTADSLKSAGEAAIIHFKAIAPGASKIFISNSNNTMATGNVSGTDKTVTIGQITNLSYIIGGSSLTPTPTPGVGGTGPVLNFDVSFNYVLPTAQCANWPVQVRVMDKDGNFSQTFDNVALTKTSRTNANGETIYRGSVVLSGFTKVNNLAVFIKGPKHLGIKYGVDKQTSYYKTFAGTIGGLTYDASTSPTFDFSGYHLLAGDVTGSISGVQDGVIDGRDFSFVKDQTSRRMSVSAGQDIQSDFNGDCITNASDTIIFVQSLIANQEQTY